jgi:MFS family permease
MGLLDKSRIVAHHGFDRWLVPPAALAIHLSIGQAYAFSVFNVPLSRALGIRRSLAGDWKLTQIGWTFTFAIVALGLSAAFAGRWVERVGPRTSGAVAGLLWSGGFLFAALGVRVHSLTVLYLGYGVLGGCGLGIGYITPVSTLIKWFPDRRGLATGMAIMGFGGGAMIASPLSDALMRRFASATSTGVADAFVTLGVLYGVAMLAGAFAFRLPPPGWAPSGFDPSRAAPDARALVSAHHVRATTALRTPQFYLLWVVLFVNVTAGIGVLGQASAMIQEVFRGRIGVSAAAGFVGLLSLFNMAGRFAWASLSDRIGRKATYAAFFLLGPFLYAMVPIVGSAGNVVLFVACVAAVMSMYGGGFATIPAYLADLFGTQFVGAIHGRLLTAWSAAGIAGPALVNYVRQHQIERGIAPAHAYDVTMYTMSALLFLGLVSNFAVRAVDERFWMTAVEVDVERKSVASASEVIASGERIERGARGWLTLAMAWIAVGAPLAWGVYSTSLKAMKLFR